MCGKFGIASFLPKPSILYLFIKFEKKLAFINFEHKYIKLIVINFVRANTGEEAIEIFN